MTKFCFFFKRFAEHDFMAATVFSKLYYRSENCFDFGNANISSYGAELVETSRKEKRN